MNAESETILLADDAPDNSELTITAFRQAGVENPIHAVCHVDETLQYLKGEGPYVDRKKFPVPRVVLLETQMPGGSGWTILEWIRQQPQFRLLPVIVLTGSVSPDDEKRAIELGASGYEVKPQSFHALVETVKKLTRIWLRSGEPPRLGSQPT